MQLHVVSHVGGVEINYQDVLLPVANVVWIWFRGETEAVHDLGQKKNIERNVRACHCVLRWQPRLGIAVSGRL